MILSVKKLPQIQLGQVSSPYTRRFELQGESMRKKRGNLVNDFIIEKK